MNNHKLNASPIDAKTHNAAIFPLTTNFTTPEYNGGPYVPYHNNQNPRLDLKTVYSLLFTHHTWFWLLWLPVIRKRGPDLHENKELGSRYTEVSIERALSPYKKSTNPAWARRFMTKIRNSGAVILKFYVERTHSQIRNPAWTINTKGRLRFYREIRNLRVLILQLVSNAPLLK